MSNFSFTPRSLIFIQNILMLLDLGRHFGFESTDYEIIPFSQFENKMAEIRGGRGYEGSVLYFMDKGIKIKYWIIIIKSSHVLFLQIFFVFLKNFFLSWQKSIMILTSIF